MAWARKRTTADGNLTFRGYYRDPDGRTRSAGSFPSSRAALRAAAREQGKVSDGTWLDPTLGKITFRDFVETVWFPSRHLEPRPGSPTGPTSTGISCPHSGPGPSPGCSPRPSRNG